MTKTARKLLIGAALTGFVAGTTAALTAAPSPGADDSGKSTTKGKVEKHCCAGQNS